jgi:outer membrane protein
MKASTTRSFVIILCLGFLGISLGAANLRAQHDPAPPSTASSASASTAASGSPATPSPDLGPGVAAFDYSKSHMFPNLLAPYTPPPVPQPSLSNSQLLHSLTQDGKLRLSLEDAIALALENNLDIAVARYQIPFAQTDYLRAKSGGATRGVTGAFQSSAQFAGAIGGGVSGFSGGSTGGAGGITGGGSAINVGATGCCDPVTGFDFGWAHVASPLNYTVVAGLPVVTTQNTSYTGFLAQGFLTGTSYAVGVSGFRQSTTSLDTLFNPEVPVGLTFGINQEVLNGFGYRANAIFIRQAKNERKIADSTFRQQVIATVGSVANLYYTLLFDQESIRVAQEAVNYDQTLLEDNKKQVQIGTLAPIEVVRAESQLATDQQNLIVAQTTSREDAEKLKTAIAKRVDPDLAGSELQLTDTLPEPTPGDIPPLEQALREADQNRPEIEQADLNLRNQDITIQSVRNRLLPTLDLYATYAPTGLSGNAAVLACAPGYSLVPGTTECTNATGALTLASVTGTIPGGFGQALTQVLHGTYPDYSYGFNLTIPIRNRAAQADAARAQLEQRELQAMLQRQRNQIEQDVRNAEIAVTQAKAQIDAASKATELARQTLDAERKKFQLGESTTLNVILTAQQLTAAEGNETKARSNYAQALITYAQATATILDKYHVQMADARKGQVTRVPNIPGTPSSPSPAPSSTR